MALREELSKQGDWLFRWRSFLPLLILPVLSIAVYDSALYSTSFGPHIDALYAVGCIVISFLGFLIRAVTIGFIPAGTSGGNTKQQKAAVLNTTGIYANVRHPLYLGNFIIFLGILLFIKVWWFVGIAICVFWLYYERIMYREEDFLRDKFDTAYLQWSEKTPAFLPRKIRWQKPEMQFSLWRIIKREYIGYFEMVTIFTLLTVAQNYLRHNTYMLSQAWAVFFCSGLVFFISIRVAKKIIRMRQRRK